MDYRDERDALRAQKEALEQELAAARADAEGKERLEKELAAKEKELVRLRSAAGPTKGRSPAGVLAMAGGAIGVAVMACGAASWLRRPTPAPEEATTAPVAPAAVATILSASPVQSATQAEPSLKFSLAFGGLAPLGKDDAGSDGIVAIVFEDKSGQRSYSAVALSGSPVVERWRLGPYGARAPRVWTANNRALVIDDERVAHVIDTDKGRELATVAGMTDAPARVCVRDAQTWITGIDDKSIGINLETGAASVGAQLLKRECPPLPGPRQTACHSISAQFCGGNAPGVPSFALKVALATDRTAVAVGVKSPGTADVLATGFDPKTRAIRWRSPIADDDEAEPLGEYPPIVAALDDDLFVAIEHLRSGPSKLRAFDAKTGQRRFTYAFPKTNLDPPPSVVLGADRIFTSQWGNLYVIDRVSGKELARLGKF